MRWSHDKGRKLELLSQGNSQVPVEIVQSREYFDQEDRGNFDQD